MSVKEDTEGVYVVVPAYNEETTVSWVIEELANRGYNIILVNDGSKDNTLKNAMESQKKYPYNIHIASHIINRGLGAALKTGMVIASNYGAKYIITFDSDGQHEFNDIQKVCKPLKEGRADVVIGARLFKDMPFTKNFANTVMNLLTLIFYHVNVKDSQSGLRAFTIDAANKLNVVSEGYGVSSEFIREIKENHLKLEEVYITTIYTEDTQHKGTNMWVGFKIMCKMFLDMFRI
ncbi:MAG: glycosyltransferase family 2 protein [archaeon]|nr:glycosyltransferase family 2 protein [archaeon]